jgi:hypothetical protein
VVVRDELKSGRLREICRVPGLTKPFYAITLQRKFPNPLVRELIARSEAAHAVTLRESKRKCAGRARNAVVPGEPAAENLD